MQREEMRLHALRQLSLLDTPPSESFDRITRMASRIFDLPIAAVSLTDQDRQWFKSRVGVEHWQIPRERAPCAEVAETTGPLVIPDLLKDECYRESLLAQSGIRFYAGAPLLTRDGFSLGAMCVLGTEPRQVTAEEQSALTDLAAMVMAQIELQHAFGRIEPVSGLPNRHQFLEDLQDEARDHPGEWRSLVMAEAAEPSRLREALRVLGPGAVDDLLRAATRALHSALGPEVKIYHVGPTQFAWLTRYVRRDSRAPNLARTRRRVERHVRSKILPALANPVVGIAPFRLGEVMPEHILRAAHSAAQDARNTDQLVSIYSEAADGAHQRRFQLLSDMPAALACKGQLSLVYQPRVALSSGACVGFEALLRWSHPLLGNVSPAEFVPLVEQTDLARPVTEWVIEAALMQALVWRSVGIDVPISVNVSVSNLEQSGFVAWLIQRLSAAQLPFSALEVEVTESSLIQNGTRVGQHLQEIRDAGMKVAIDDFGTGYSSLSYLQSLPADIVKIDQSFMRNLASNPRGRTLVASMVAMARSLDFKVVAEGVEDDDACTFLRSTGCNEAQGYLISRPMAADAVGGWIAGRTTRSEAGLAERAA